MFIIWILARWFRFRECLFYFSFFAIPIYSLFTLCDSFLFTILVEKFFLFAKPKFVSVFYVLFIILLKKKYCEKYGVSGLSGCIVAVDQNIEQKCYVHKVIFTSHGSIRSRRTENKYSSLKYLRHLHSHRNELRLTYEKEPNNSPVSVCGKLIQRGEK